MKKKKNAAFDKILLKAIFERTYFLLFLILFLAVALRLAFFSGMGTSDSLSYSRFAAEIAKGGYSAEQNNLNTRLGTILPTAFFYRVFGINDAASVAFPFIMSVIGIILMFFLGKLLFNEKIGLIGAFLLSIFPLDVVYSTQLLSDLPSAALSAISVYLFLRSEMAAGANLRALFLALSGAALAASYSTREMGILTSLFFVCYALYNKKFSMEYFYAAFGFIAIFSLELIFYYIKTGDAFYRFSLFSSHYLNAVETVNYYNRFSFPEFFLAYPFVIFSDIRTGYFFSFIFLAAIFCLINRKKETDYLLIWLFAILIYLNVGSASLTKYVPFLAVARYLSYIAFPGILLLSYLLYENSEILRKSFFPFVMVLLLAVSIGAIYLDKSRPNLDNIRAAHEFVKYQDKIVYTDYRTKYLLDYLSGYENPERFRSISKSSDINDLHNSLVLIDKRMIDNLEDAKVDVSYLKDLQAPSHWKVEKILGNNGEVTIYSVK